jgi:hypothetical protein
MPIPPVSQTPYIITQHPKQAAQTPLSLVFFHLPFSSPCYKPFAFVYNVQPPVLVILHYPSFHLRVYRFRKRPAKSNLQPKLKLPSSSLPPLPCTGTGGLALLLLPQNFIFIRNRLGFFLKFLTFSMTTPFPSSFPLSLGLSSVIAGLSPSLREQGLLLVGV